MLPVYTAQTTALRQSRAIRVQKRTVGTAMDWLGIHRQQKEEGLYGGRPVRGVGILQRPEPSKRKQHFTVQNNRRGVLFTKNRLNVTTERVKTLLRVEEVMSHGAHVELRGQSSGAR